MLLFEVIRMGITFERMILFVYLFLMSVKCQNGQLKVRPLCCCCCSVSCRRVAFKSYNTGLTDHIPSSQMCFQRQVSGR